MRDTQVEIILKGWSLHSELVRGFGENCWKIRSIYFTSAFGLIAAGFTTNAPELYLLVPILSVGFFLLESGYRRLQLQYIWRLKQIERSVNDLLASEPHPYIPNHGVSTALDTPKLGSLVQLLRPKRYLFWLSYLIVTATAVSLFFLGVEKAKVSCPDHCKDASTKTSTEG